MATIRRVDANSTTAPVNAASTGRFRAHSAHADNANMPGRSSRSRPRGPVSSNAAGSTMNRSHSSAASNTTPSNRSHCQAADARSIKCTP